MSIKLSTWRFSSIWSALHSALVDSPFLVFFLFSTLINLPSLVQYVISDEIGLWVFQTANIALTAVLFELFFVVLPRRLALAFFFCALTIHSLLEVYSFLKGTKLDFPVVWGNLTLILTSEFLTTASEFFSPFRVIFILFWIAAVLIFLRFWSPPAYEKLEGKKVTLQFLILAMLYFPAEFLGNKTLYFVRSIRSFYLFESFDFAYTPFKYVKGADRTPSQNQTNIFLVLVESFNSQFILSRSSQGIEYTPYLNKLAQEEIYLERFYGTSVQTIRGQVSAICGILPSFRSKVSVTHTDINLRCVSEILKENGYTNLFFKGHDDLSFDNTFNLFQKQEFDFLHGMTSEFVDDVPDEFFWHWGVQDDVFFKKFFEFMDTLREEGAGPFFSVLTTLSNHQMFDRVPEHLRLVYENPKDYREHYANSIFLTDRFLEEFMRQLERREYLSDSIVIITGDHGYPVGEHGNYFNEIGAFEENFRTPFFLVLPPGFSSSTPEGTVFSQLQIPATILELLGIEARNHFQAPSVFEPWDLALFSQPYDGIYLGGVRWPYKYLYRISDGNEFLFNLEVDPLEEDNLKVEYPEKLKEMRELKEVHLVNQKMIEQNEIYRDTDRVR